LTREADLPLTPVIFEPTQGDFLDPKKKIEKLGILGEIFKIQTQTIDD